jgi:hypothetical protein
VGSSCDASSVWLSICGVGIFTELDHFPAISPPNRRQIATKSSPNYYDVREKIAPIQLRRQ